MKTILLLIGMSLAANSPVPTAFPSNCAKYAVTASDPLVDCYPSGLCCTFSNSKKGKYLMRCMTDSQRSSAYFGTYVDD